MRLSRDFVRSFQYIGFDLDEGGCEGIGFPIFKNNFLPYRPAEPDPSSYLKFRSLELQDPTHRWSTCNSELRSFSWIDARHSGGSILTMKFELRNSNDILLLTYGAPRMLAETGLSVGLQSLYVEALGHADGVFRHEFLFHNAVLIIESKSFDFNIESAESQR